MAAAVPMLGFAERFRAPGQPMIAPDRFATALNLQLQDLARLAGVHRKTVTDSPGNARLQAYLRVALKVLCSAVNVAGDDDRAIYWYRNVPISALRHQTAEELVAEGRAEVVLKYLQSIESGASG